MQPIDKADIVGSRIAEIHATHENHDGCDFTSIYFTNDRGITFTMPLPEHEWIQEKVPEDAEEVPDEYEEMYYAVQRCFLFWRKLVPTESRTIDLVKQMKSRKIEGVFCAKLDEELEFYEPDDVFIGFDDGSRAYCISVAPHGTGASGLHYITDSDISDEKGEVVDFFSLPSGK